MKKLLFIILFIFISSVCYADKLVWQPPVTGEPLGYKIYYNEFSKNVGNVLELNNFETVLNLVPGVEYIISASAYNLIGEGSKCDSLTYTRVTFIPTDNPDMTIVINIPPGAPVTINVE